MRVNIKRGSLLLIMLLVLAVAMFTASAEKSHAQGDELYDRVLDLGDRNYNRSESLNEGNNWERVYKFKTEDAGQYEFNIGGGIYDEEGFEEKHADEIADITFLGDEEDWLDIMEMDEEDPELDKYIEENTVSVGPGERETIRYTLDGNTDYYVLVTTDFNKSGGQCPYSLAVTHIKEVAYKLNTTINMTIPKEDNSRWEYTFTVPKDGRYIFKTFEGTTAEFELTNLTTFEDVSDYLGNDEIKSQYYGMLLGFDLKRDVTYGLSITTKKMSDEHGRMHFYIASGNVADYVFVPAKYAHERELEYSTKYEAVYGPGALVLYPGADFLGYGASVQIKAEKRKDVGRTITRYIGVAPYVGTKIYYGKILPNAPHIGTIKAQKKSLKIGLHRPGSGANGYQIRYSLKKGMPARSTRTITINAKKGRVTYHTIKKLKKKKRYYIQARTFKTVNGVRYYSGWSRKVSRKTR